MAIDLLLDTANRALLRLGAKTISSLTEESDRARVCNAEITECRKETLRAHPWNFARRRVQLNGFASVAVTPSSEAVTKDATATFTALTPFFTAGQDEGTRLMGNSGIARVASVVDTRTVTAVVETAFADAGQMAAGSWRLAPGWQWEFRYAKPSDYIRVVEVQGVSVKGTGASVLWSWWRDLSTTPEPVTVEDQSLVSNSGGKLNISYTRDVDDLSKWDVLSKSALAALLAFRICYAITGSLQAAKTQHDAYKEILAEARTMNGQERGVDEFGSDLLTVVRI